MPTGTGRSKIQRGAERLRSWSRQFHLVSPKPRQREHHLEQSRRRPVPEPADKHHLERRPSPASSHIIRSKRRPQRREAAVTYPNRIDAWVVNANSRYVVHDFWEPENDVWRSPENSISWDSEPSGNQIVGSAPAVVCRDDAHMHDIVAYTTAGVPLHRSYSNVTGSWSNWTVISDAVKFIGDPVVLQFDNDPTRFDFFGLDTEHHLWRMIWIANQTGYTRIGRLIGPVVNSMPPVMVTGTRVDLVVTGADDKVYHLALVDSDLGSEADWEIVGDYANSAPVVAGFMCENGQSCTGIMTLGETENGGSSLMFTHWESTLDTRWQSHVTEWKNVGGNLTAQYMVV